MDYKTLVKRFAKACYRFEALQENLDILLFDTDDEIKANEYEDLADQAAEIVLKLSANGNNVGMHFYNYYLCRLEYIIAYFRELLDDEPAAETHFEGFPAGCVFPKFPEFFLGGFKVGENWTAKNEETDAVKEDNSEDAQPEELDNEDDDQTAESDEDYTLFSDDDLPPGVEEKPANLWLGWDKLTWEERRRVKDSVALFYRLDDITAQDDESPAAPILTLADSPHTLLRHYIRFATAQSILAEERELRRLLWKAIDAIPDFRDSEEFKTIIERFPTYKHLQ